jgi:phosphoglycerate dehydrogenase-like enzyme
MSERARIGILDDYQGVALELADWTAVRERADISRFRDHLAEGEVLIERLQPFEVLCVMRERTPLRRTTLERLPNLKLICSTAPRNASIDMAVAEALGIKVAHTGYFSTPTVELTFALMLESLRHIGREHAALAAGGWQQTVGEDLARKTLGIIGLGHIGSAVAKVALAFGMRVIAWSQNLDDKRAAAAGAQLVTKDQLLAESDIVTLHLVLSARTAKMIGARELALMKPSARLINTSRGPLVEEGALIDALNAGRIAGAAIDVYDIEPLPQEHPYRHLPNLLSTPHIGYVTRDLYERFYGDTVKNVLEYLKARPARRNPS